MLGRQFEMAIAATVLAAGTLTGLQGTFCRTIASDARALYLWAEYKMIVGDKESALKLLQESSIQKSQTKKCTSTVNEKQREMCSRVPANVTTMMF